MNLESSEEKLSQCVSDLFQLATRQAKRASPFVEIKQECLIIDRSPIARISIFQDEVASLSASRTDLGWVNAVKKLAIKHDLVCHFKSQLYSWTLIADSGENLLQSKVNNLVFFILLTAIEQAVHEHAALLSIVGFDLTPFIGGQIVFKAKSSLILTLFHAVVADRLRLLLDEIQSAVGDRNIKEEELWALVLPILNKEKTTVPIPHFLEALRSLMDKKTAVALDGILKMEELQNLYSHLVEEYGKDLQMQAEEMIALSYQCGKGVDLADELKLKVSQMSDMGWEAKAKVFYELIAPKTALLKALLKENLPKYQELLLVL